ncbi:MAG: bifunctional UDP-sugar hydrolase/5'-nucleotidase [Clostridia bacterium]
MRKFLSALLVLLMLLPLCTGCSALAQGEGETLSILFTHDMHSHLEATADGMGGMEKLATLVAKRKGPTTLLVDAGDFSMGTLYQTIYETHASELTTMSYIGYDAVTFGNHEFDYRGEGLAHMLQAAVKNAAADPSLTLAALVASNINWTANDTETNRELKAAFDAYGGAPYTIVERGGLRIGIFGIFGKDAEACAPLSGVAFTNQIDAAKQTVAQLQAQSADLILCLSHSGTWRNPNQSEDELLAKAVPEIDVIISGHTHSVLTAPIVHGSTFIVSAGEYCQNLGEIKLERADNGRWALADYQLHPLDLAIEPDAAFTARLAQYRETVNSEYLARYGYSFDQVLADNPIDFGTSNDVQRTHGESTLGNLLSDAYIYAVQQAEGAAYRPVDWAVTATGIIRDTFAPGKLTVSDVFNVCSLGIGPDRVPGYPLISLYLTGAELKTAAEVDASISGLMDGSVLFASGGGWRYNTNRLLLNRVTEVWVTDADGTLQPVRDDQLYRVVANLYMGQMLGSVNSKSLGLLALMPKDENGQPITDFETRILHDANGNELKEWTAVAAYLRSFDLVNGLPTVPQRYAQVEGRKLVETSANPIELLKQPNKVFWIVLCVLVLIAAILTAVIFLIVRLCKRLRRKRARS